MQRYNGQLINQFPNTVFGNAAAGVSVTVKVKSTGVLATLYSDNSTASPTLTNPLTTDSVGAYSFYAADGVYTLDFSFSGLPQQVVQLQDVAELQSRFDDAVLNAGYIPSGTFTAGATLTQSNQVLSDGSSYWRWDGSFPKVVSAASSPTPTGVGAWIVVSDQALRGDLAVTASIVPIAGTEAQVVGLLQKTTASGAMNSSFILGYKGTTPASAPTRTTYLYSATPTTGTNGLFLTGNYIEPAVLGASIFQGRSGYYSYFTSEAGVASSMGGDNYVNQLAGLAYAFHVDLLKDSNGLGSHGAAFGGSWKVLRGDYSGSFAGTVHLVSGQNAVVIGGNNHRLGSSTDALLSRRSSIVGGQLVQLDGINSFVYSSDQSTMTGDNGGILGGLTITNAASQSVMLGGNTNEHTSAALRSVTLGGQRNKTTAFMAVTSGSDALNDVDYSQTSASGKFANQGDCQVHRMTARRAGSAGSTTVDITAQGGSGAPYLYTPRTNTVAAFDFIVVGARTDIQGESCSFRVTGTISNIGGTLSIKAQTTTVIHRDDAAYNCVLALAGGSTAVVLRATVPSTSHATRWSASGTVTMLQSA